MTIARVAVHFNSVCDRFSPYDTTFSIAHSKELKDTKLSAACSLHTASGSTSSSTSSLRRRRLMEIAEEEEEEQREKKRQSTVNEEDRPRTPGPDDPKSPTSPPVTLNSDLATSLAASKFAATTEPPSFIGVPRPSSPAKSFDDAARRKSAYPTRQDLYGSSAYAYAKPKVKLGPRPSLDVGGRPRTSAGTDHFRPVATLPTRLKLSAKGSKKGKPQDKPADQPESPTIEEEGAERLQFALLNAPISEDLVTQPDVELIRPHTSGGGRPSFIALTSNVPTLPPPPTKRNTMTPEKARLMKAMKLREMKKMASSQPPTTAAAATAAPEAASEPNTPEVSVESKEEAVDQQATGDQEELAVKSDARLSMSNADSGVGLDIPNDHISVDTRIESHPASPVPSSSDNGESTKASSVSETTDETVHPNHEHKDSQATVDGFEDRDEPESDSAARPASDEPQVPDQDQTSDEAQAADNIETPIEVPATDEIEAPDESQSTDKVKTPDESQFTDDIENPTPETIQDEKEDVADQTEAVTGEDETTILAEEEPTVVQSPAVPISKFAKSPTVQVNEAEVADDTAQPDPTTGTDSETLLGETARDELPVSPRFEIPLSRFSTLDVKRSSRAVSSSAPSVAAQESEHKEDAAPIITQDNKSVKDTDASETASIQSRRSKRKTLVDPIRTDLPDKEAAHSEANLSDDDDLMEELQSATLQHAQPIMVAKSPMNTVFPGLPKRSATDLEQSNTALRSSRAVSNPIRASTLTPAEGATGGAARTVSTGAAFLPKITEPQPSPSAELRPKTPKLGSSISQRIKALEMRSGGSASGDSAPKERTTSSFFSVRKTSVRAASRSPSVAERADSIKRGTTPSPPESRESSPETARLTRGERSGSMASRLSVFEGGNAPRGRPESIQVTARIVRDPSQPFPKVPELKADAADYGPLALRQSPLVVDHQKATQVAVPPTDPTSTTPAPAQPEQKPQVERKPSLLQRRLSKERRSQSQDRVTENTNNEFRDETGPVNRPRRRSSLTVVKDFIKDRRDSLLSGKFPSTDNLNLHLSPSPGGLASPAVLTPSRSPSRPPSVHHNSLFPRRLSIGSRRSSIDQKSPLLPAAGPSTSPLSPSLMTEASGESDGDEHKRSGSGSSAGTTSPNAGGKGSRATRFMRRLSSSLGSGRKNVTPSISPTVAEENDAEVAAQSGGSVPPSSSGGHAAPSIVSYMGDVNVQFPDNLLWKRRTMCLDSQGFLILSASQGVSPTAPMAAVGMTTRDKHLQAGVIKRYHLSDFRSPYTPEMEAQELPNSVVLDFVDGSGLQIACEDRAGQLNILHSELQLFLLTQSR